MIDEQWTEFYRLAQTDRKLPGSSEHWKQARCAWSVLDGFQKAAAIRHLAECNGMETTHSRPHNYVRQRLWEVPEPVARPQKPAAKSLSGALAKLRGAKQSG